MKAKKRDGHLFTKRIIIYPNASELYYALTFVYIQTQNLEKTQQTALKLKQLIPNNPNYQELFKSLRSLLISQKMTIRD